MVCLTRVLLGSAVKATKPGFRKSNFLDQMRMHVQGGTGGMGQPKYGGVGGKGGDVYIVAEEAMDLKGVLQKYPDRRVKAGHGGNSLSRQLLGTRGQDATITVPCGVRVITNFKSCIGEVNAVGEKLLVAKGGVGGCSVNNFSGMKGQAFNVKLELCLIADIGLLGFPNAGKSTLLKACSRARPKIAAYPFTTIKPNLAVLEYKDYRKITMADLPGLIEGAHENFGMGHQFLRHVERTKCMLMVVDVNGFQLSLDHPKRSAIETVFLLIKELELYNSDLLDKPISLIVNKMDLPNAEENFQSLKAKLAYFEENKEEIPKAMRPERLVKFQEIIPISAQQGASEVVRVKEHVRSVLDMLVEDEVVREEVKFKLQRMRSDQYEKGPRLI